MYLDDSKMLDNIVLENLFKLRSYKNNKSLAHSKTLK